MKTREIENEEFAAATELARQVRREVGEQLRSLVVEADRMAGPGDLKRQVELIVGAQRRIAEAQAQQLQARTLGLPLAAPVRAEAAAVNTLRSLLMDGAVVLACWSAAIDFAERKRSEVEVDTD